MISISPLSVEDLPNRVDLLNDQRISTFLNVNESFTLETTLAWFQRRNLSTRFDCIFRDQELKDTIIGYGGLSNISINNQNAELYMYISPKYQGKGLGYESLKELCKYGFTVLTLHKIYLYTFSSNIRANHLYEKVGFIKEGHLREHTMKNGTLQDRYLYGLLKTEFKYL